MLRRALAADRHFFYDPEYLELFTKDRVTYYPVSLAIVPLDPAEPEFYAISKNFNVSLAKPGSFAHDVVLPRLDAVPGALRATNKEIRDQALNYLRKLTPPGETVALWSYDNVRDIVIWRQLCGTEPDAFFHGYDLGDVVFPDLKDFQAHLQAANLPARDEQTKHNALADARWHRGVFKHLYELQYRKDLGRVLERPDLPHLTAE